ncbi:MAG: hypothetical protein ACRDL6_01860, partial [Solirubrobacterales bacterium]
ATAADSAGGAKAPAAGPKVEPGSPGLPDGYEVAKGGGVGVELTDPIGNRYRYEGLKKLSPELRPGTQLEGGQVLGPLEAKKPMVFSLTAAGGAQIDPRPMVDGYRLQEAADYFHAVEPIGGNPFLPDTQALAGKIIAGNQAQLSQQVVADPGISIYACGRQDVEQGKIDTRILGALLYLRRAGLTLTVTSLNCGHSFYTAGGSISAHSYGAAVDIAAFNGEPVLGHQGPGSLTEYAIRLLMQLEGEARPNQLISLMSLGGPSFALGDHADHLHVGFPFSTALGLGRSGDALGGLQFGGGAGAQGLGTPQKGPAAKKNEQRLSERLGKVRNPEVPSTASPGAPRVRGEGERRSERRAASTSDLHEGGSLELSPASSGAEMVAVDIPAGAKGEAYGIGLVDGAAHGWADRQVVVLAAKDGAWRVIGPPVDQAGKAANPKLSELATAAGGEGYAVGKDGAVVHLRGENPPRLISSPVKSDLKDVDVAVIGGRPVGFAAAGDDAVLRLSGGQARRQPTNPAQATIDAVTLGGAEPVAVGSGAAGRPTVFKQAGGAWRPIPLDLGLAPGSTATLEAVAASGSEVWVGGSLAESPGTPLEVPFVAHQGAGGGWQTFCSINPALSVVEELGQPSSGPCDQGLPSSSPGARVTAIALTADGPIAASGSYLVPLNPGSKLRATAASGPITDLATDLSRTRGFALRAQGGLVRIGPEAAAPESVGVQELPLGNARPVVVAATKEGRAIALGAGQSAVRGEDGWQLGQPTGLAVRDVAWSDEETAWAIDELGTPLTLTDEGWVSPGEDDSAREERAELVAKLGGFPLSPPGSKGEQQGLRALAFTPEGLGFAAGGGSLSFHGAESGWHRLDSEASFNDVAAGPGAAIAVGEGAALLDLRDQHSGVSETAKQLAQGADLTAASVLDDGTMLAAGSGVVLARDAGADDWATVELPPLGLPVSGLAGVRGGDGELSVFTLVDTGGGHLVLLRGEGGSWRTVGLPDGVTPSDMAPVPESGSLLLGGDRTGRAVAIDLDPDGGGEKTDAAATGAQGEGGGHTRKGKK